MYMYIETSSPRSTGDNAKLQLAVPRSESSSCLMFFYHMYGSSMGTLNVFSGNAKIFTKSGNQGYYWKKVTRTLHLSDVVSIIGIYITIKKFYFVALPPCCQSFASQPGMEIAHEVRGHYSQMRPQLLANHSSNHILTAE